MDPVQLVSAIGEIELWRQVELDVPVLYKEALDVTERVRAVVDKAHWNEGQHDARLFWDRSKQTLNVSLPKGSDASLESRWSNILRPIAGVTGVKIDTDWVPKDCVEIKYAAELNWLGSHWQGANKAIGGPNPLTNMIVGGLLAGGAGYAGGKVLQTLFPDRYVEGDKLPHTLGMAGAVAGIAPGLLKAYNYSQNDNSNILKAMVTSDHAPPASPMEKLSAGFSLPSQTGAFGLRSIPVDAFNRVVWNDVRKGVATAASNPYGTKSPWGTNEQELHTPPAVAAATTGLMSGIQAQVGSRMISPGDIVRGIASAGVGLATAHVAGRALGALAGLTPDAQNKLQDVGVFAGVLNGIVPPLFGW